MATKESGGTVEAGNHRPDIQLSSEVRDPYLALRAGPVTLAHLNEDLNDWDIEVIVIADRPAAPVIGTRR